MNTHIEEASCCPCKCKQKKPLWKNLLGLALIAFAAIAALRAFNFASEAPPQKAESEASVESRKLTIFYFHGRQRCMMCNRMEQMVREVAANIPSVEIKAVNLDEIKNEHYISDFGLTTRTVVLRDGTRFAVLDKCWTLAHDEAAFKDYVARIIADFIAIKE